MSHLSYDNSVPEHSAHLHEVSLRGFMQLLPYITVNEMEKLAESNHHLSEQLPRYLSDMVSHECRIIGF